MKSSLFGLGVNEADVQLFMNVTYYKFGSSHENFVVWSSIFSNVVLTDGTGSFCNGVVHSLFNHRNGSISVVWTL